MIVGMTAPESCLLENETLSVAVRPGEGGRIASLRSRQSGVEFLTQVSAVPQFGEPGVDAAFRNGYCAGVEECLPTVGPSEADAEGGPVPDHGDFWQIAWTLDQPATSNDLLLSAEGFSRPFRFSKALTLHGSRLQVDYCVENLADRPLTFLYACHPLFAVDPGDLVLLPSDVESLRLDYSRGGRLGCRGTSIQWPRPKAMPGTDLSRVGAAADRTAEMFYTERLQDGRCGVYRCGPQQGLTVDFDTARLPYLGVWLCYGGWPDEGDRPLQYAVALEPTLAPRNTLAEARRAGSARKLEPGERYTWSIGFQVSRPGLSFAEFSDSCASQTR